MPNRTQYHNNMESSKLLMDVIEVDESAAAVKEDKDHRSGVRRSFS